MVGIRPGLANGFQEEAAAAAEAGARSTQPPPAHPAARSAVRATLLLLLLAGARWLREVRLPARAGPRKVTVLGVGRKRSDNTGSWALRRLDCAAAIAAAAAAHSPKRALGRTSCS